MHGRKMCPLTQRNEEEEAQKEIFIFFKRTLIPHDPFPSNLNSRVEDKPTKLQERIGQYLWIAIYVTQALNRFVGWLRSSYKRHLYSKSPEKM